MSNGYYGYGPPGGQVQGQGPGPAPRVPIQRSGLPQDPRPAINDMQPRQNSPAGQMESNQSRAARYEDEKRRIIESCFAKKEPDGTLLESYITHVRVVEDAMYPSSPPPPDSAPNNKKNRLILVAVRKSGRVRVHKARENPSGSFSIGKTWALDDLTAIHIYTGGIPTDEREHMERQWAGDAGFTVTLGKPYYWHAPTSKEKDFFIASLLKIYKKYTGGKTPELTGFSLHQKEQFGSNPSSRTPSSTVSQTPSQYTTSTPTLPTPISQPSQSSPQSRLPPAPVLNRFDQPPQNRNELRPVAREERGPPSSDPVRSPARIDRRMPSRENIRGSPDIPPAASVPNVPIPTTSPASAPIGFASSTQNHDTTSRGGSTLLPTRPSEIKEQQRYRSTPPQASQESLSNRSTNGSSIHLNKSSQDQTYSGEYAPAKLPVANRSQSSLQSSDRPTTAASDATSTLSKYPPPEPMPATDRQQPFLNKPNQTTSTDSSRFVTPVTTPSAQKQDSAKASISSIQQTPAESEAPALPKAGYFAAVTLAPKDGPKSPEPKRVQPTPIATTTEPTSLTATPETAEPEELGSPGKTAEETKAANISMLKKKDAADKFRKAAFAVNAFKPRQGGGAARLKAMQEDSKKGNEPDGITEVVPAPLFRGMSSDSVNSSAPPTPLPPGLKDRPSTPQASAIPPRVNLERSATEDSVGSIQSQQSVPTPVSEKQRELLDAPVITEVKPVQQQIQRPQTPEKPRSRSPQRRKRQRQEQDIAKYSSSLGVDPRIFEGRGGDFADLLQEFGWTGKLNSKRRIEDFETDIRREIGRAQATGWLGHIEQQDVKVLELSKAFDRAIEECEELDGLFTLYSHELDTLSADIEYIEAQSQGLQVQTANQKLLQKELRGLLSTLRISKADLQGLQYGALETSDGIGNVEQALSTLYKALVTIDPNIRQNRKRREGQGVSDRTGVGVYADAELGQMRAVREKKDEYGEQTNAFIRRFCQHMNNVFKTLEQSRDDDVHKTSQSDSISSLSTTRTQRQELWLYNGIMLFVREVNSYEWKTLIKSYEMNVRGSYQENFRNLTMASRRDTRKPGQEEQEALFTYQEKEKPDESLSSAARKLTVKRGRTVKTAGLKSNLSNKNQDGKPDAHEAFQSTLEQQSKIIAEEQNFMVTFFHLSSQSATDFTELVSGRPPVERRLPDLSFKIPFEPDKNISGTVQASIEAIYSFWLSDLQGQLEWVLKQDQLQGIGVMCALEHNLNTYEDSNQEFITTTVRTLHGRLVGMFHKFVDEQVKAIEETKVKLKKRKGIISFMRTFPVFSTAVEGMVPESMVANENLEVWFILNDAYSKILRAMWESLTFIAKDDTAQNSGSHNAAPAGGDPEDKEALNYHILLIENMNHYLEEVDTHDNLVLEEWKTKATDDMLTHLTQYTDAVIRRPLGKWLDFVESTEAMMKNADGYQSVSSKPSHSRSTCKKIIKAYDAAEIRKGVETLKKRIDKHFGDFDEPTTMSKSLIARVYEECSARYAHAHDRMKLIIDKVYDGTLDIDWRKEEITSMFKR